MDIKIPFQLGDIIQHKDGGCAIVNHVNEYLCLVGCFNSTTAYTLGEVDFELWHKIGTYDLTNIASAIKEAKAEYIDIQTQVNMALQIMGHTYAHAGDSRRTLIGDTISVNKELNKVFIQVYPDIGDPYTSEPVLDIIKRFDIKISK